jgi:hypothetical protein
MTKLIASLYRDAWQVEEIMAESFDQSPSDDELWAQSIKQRAHELLSNHAHFRRRAGGFQYQYFEEALIVHGSVPSFYLKQLLQTVLMELDGIQRIENRVDVISSYGLSSVSRLSRLQDDGAYFRSPFVETTDD